MRKAACSRPPAEHRWESARKLALARDGACVLCGATREQLKRALRAEIERRRALTRAGVRCPYAYDLQLLFRLEVDHIEPRSGQGYRRGCWHHLDNLRTLCHRCHSKVSALQRIDRRDLRQGQLRLIA